MDQSLEGLHYSAEEVWIKTEPIDVKFTSYISTIDNKLIVKNEMAPGTPYSNTNDKLLETASVKSETKFVDYECISEDITRSETQMPNATRRRFKCDECERTFQKSSNLKVHQRIHSGVKPFSCDECGKSFNQPQSLNRHKLIHSSIEKLFGCHLCDWKSNYISNMKRHMKKHLIVHQRIKPFSCDGKPKLIISSSEKPFGCDLCGWKSNCTFDMKRHMEKHNDIRTGKRLFYCDKCELSFTEEDIYIEHRLIHTTGQTPFVCKVCGMKFMYKTVLRHHIKKGTVCGKKLESETILACHTSEQPSSAATFPSNVKGALPVITSVKSGVTFSDSEPKSSSDSIVLQSSKCEMQMTNVSDKRFNCGECEKTFATKGNLQLHRRTHTGERPFCCDECGKSFSQPSTLSRHKLIHSGVKSHICDECGMSFARKGDVTSHKVIHGERSYCCDICGERFAQRRYILRHMETHFSSGTSYSCDQCEKSFSRKINLNRHKVTHGEKSYCCDICGERFVLRRYIVVHMETHSSCRQSHSCDQCGNSFKRKGDLTRHKLTHSKKPFDCLVCDMMFMNATALKHHKKKSTVCGTKLESETIFGM